MRVLLAILVLLTTLPCDGQVRRRVLGPKSGGSNPITLPAGIEFRWIATNLFDPVTNWLDIVGGYSWTNSANFPGFTNGTGVNFNAASSQFLRCTNKMFNTSNSFLVIFKSASASAFTPVVMQDGVGTFLYTQNSKYNNDYGTVQADTIYDLIGSHEAPAGTVTPLVYGSKWTNGVLCVTNKAINGIYATTAGKWSTTYGSMTIYELIIWSNTWTWTSSEIAQIHRYSTNRWPHSP